MATGLLALLDDVAAIAKVAAASLDDTLAAAAKAGAKAAGVVVDDAAVTPRYVHGFSADRELPIVWKIARGSIRNKLLYLLPAALLLSALAHWAITPLLMLGGAYLCFEGAEKLHSVIWPHDDMDESGPVDEDPGAVEVAMVSGAIRTDLILSGEIMAIALASVASKPILEQGIVLAVVGVGITVLVYGAVALIVKADDAGVVLARSGAGILRGLGRALVHGMPPFLAMLAGVGTAAMLWVGGGIVVHGLEEFGLDWPGHAMAHGQEIATAAAGNFAGWAAGAVFSGVFGVALGGALVLVVPRVLRMFGRGGH